MQIQPPSLRRSACLALLNFALGPYWRLYDLGFLDCLNEFRGWEQVALHDFNEPEEVVIYVLAAEHAISKLFNSFKEAIQVHLIVF